MSDKKYLEFWIWPTNDGCYTAQKYFEPKWEVQEKAHRLRVEQKWIRVIEVSALDDLRAEIEKLRNDLITSDHRGGIWENHYRVEVEQNKRTQELVGELSQELTHLKSVVRDLAGALERYKTSAFEVGGQIYKVGAVAEEALSKHADLISKVKGEGGE